MVISQGDCDGQLLENLLSSLLRVLTNGGFQHLLSLKGRVYHEQYLMGSEGLGDVVESSHLDPLYSLFSSLEGSGQDDQYVGLPET